MIDRCPRSASLALAGTALLGLALFSGAGPAMARVSPSTTAGARAPAAHGKHLIRSAHREGPARAVTNFTSNNWDGYFATDASHDTDFTAISATWTEAKVTCSSKKEAWAGFWIGLDGWWNDSVEQGGTEAICLNGSPQYSVWWEMFPFNAIQVSFAINPGDTIHASVTYSPSSKKFDIVVKDLTSGKTLTKNIACQQGQGRLPAQLGRRYLRRHHELQRRAVPAARLRHPNLQERLGDRHRRAHRPAQRLRLATWPGHRGQLRRHQADDVRPEIRRDLVHHRLETQVSPCP